MNGTLRSPHPVITAIPRRSVAVIAALLVALAGASADGRADDAAPPAAPAAAPPPAEHLAPPLLDQMLAPIALYPDALLSQILMASTYPLEVIEAYRWVSDPANAALKGPALETSLQAQDWDPSVKSLVPFPDILKVMNDKLGWMQQLGNAFLSQPQDVMDAVQRLRSQAAAAGNLKPSAQQQVVTEQKTIIIRTASPEVVYVPVYDPLVVYGPWPWAAYPPVFFGPFAGPAVRIGMFNWFSFGIVGLYWGWNSCDWRRHYIHIDRDRYDRIRDHRDRGPYPHDTWEHDPYHRRGVAYPDPDLRARFRPNPPGTPDSRRDYRGYPPATDSGRPAAPPSRPTQPNVLPPGHPIPREPGAPIRTPRGEPEGAPPVQPGRGTEPVTRPTRPPVGAPPSPSIERPDVRPSEPGTPPVEPAERPNESAPHRYSESRESLPRGSHEPRTPPAFEGYSSGEAVREAIERARNSRGSAPAPSVQTPAPAPAPAPAVPHIERKRQDNPPQRPR